MTLMIIAGLVLAPLAFIALHFIQKAAKLEVTNETTRKENKTKSRQLDIAGRPADSPDDVLKRLHNDSINK